MIIKVGGTQSEWSHQRRQRKQSAQLLIHAVSSLIVLVLADSINLVNGFSIRRPITRFQTLGRTRNPPRRRENESPPSWTTMTSTTTTMAGIIVEGRAMIFPTSTRLYATDDSPQEDSTQDDDDSDDDDDDDETVLPYGNRSLAWTKRYRRLIPYHVARAQAVAMGMSTEEDYHRWRKGPYQIQRPDEMYALEWISWDEFLGTMRSYEETRQVVRLLQLQSMEEYRDFIRQDPKRAEGLRIPAKPEIVYKDRGWQSPHLFFFGGTSDITNND